MITLIVLLRVLALVCFVMATFGVPARVNLTAAGLALWLLSLVVVIP
jgi:hypothetical protein